jgi:hypothetical protein
MTTMSDDHAAVVGRAFSQQAQAFDGERSFVHTLAAVTAATPD